MERLYLRIPRDLHRRVSLAAAVDGVDKGRVLKRVVETWISQSAPVPPPVAPSTDSTKLYCTVSEVTHRSLRIAAAEAGPGVTVHDVVLRVLHALVPFETEIHVHALNREASST